MVLGFMQKFPWGEETGFRNKILLSSLPRSTQLIAKMEGGFYPKFHTIREGQRWKAGDFIHMANGVRTKQYNQFNSDFPELQRVVSVQRIDIVHRGPGCVIVFIDKRIFFSRLAHVSETLIKKSIKTGKDLVATYGADEPMIIEYNGGQFAEFLRNDGVTEEQFFRFFKKPLRKGQLIHWTSLKY